MTQPQTYLLNQTVMYRSKYNQKCFLYRIHTKCSKKYIKEETKFLIDIFAENGHKRTFLENLFKNCNAKMKNNDSRNSTNSKNIPRVPNIGPKIRKAKHR